MKNSVAIWVAMLLLLWLVSCNNTTEVSGGGSDTEVGGSLVSILGTKGADLEVKLIPVSYNPLDSHEEDPILIDTTNSEGQYSFKHVSSGVYNIAAINPKDESGVFISDVQVMDKDILVPEDTLKLLGSMIIPLGELPNTTDGYFYLQGTEFFSAINVSSDSIEHIVMSSLPPGVFPIINYVDQAISEAPETMGVNVEILENDSVYLNPYSSWTFSRKAYLNTTPTGANVLGTVMNFPVLVRLNNMNFTFSEAEADGSDLRFTDNNSKPLSLQIERWDVAEEKAELWVLVDTLYGNNNIQNIYMYWGKNSSVSRSNGPAVFNESNGFRGVWHLNEEAVDTTAIELYKNSAMDENHGDDKILSLGNDGVIGKGHYFNTGDYIIAKQVTSLLKPTASITFSAWIRPDTTDISGGEVLSMGDDYGLRVNPTGNLVVSLYDDPQTYFLLYSNNTNVINTGWHYITGIYTGSELQIYVDGILNNTLLHSAPILYNLGSNFLIGTHGNNLTSYDFTGSMDEIRVSSIPRSADWVKLCYENQRPIQTLVEFR